MSTTDAALGCNSHCPIIPSFDGPFDFAAHKQALIDYAQWLMDAVLDQSTEKPDYTVHDAALRAIQLDEVKEGLTHFTDKTLKETRDEFSGYFAQFLQDSGQENARINVAGFGTRLVYKRETTTYSAGDPLALTTFIKHNPEHIDMLQVRVAKPAVEEYMKQTGGLPPGVNTFTEIKAYLRK